jgi:uncharacterized protein (TIGR00730 family)
LLAEHSIRLVYGGGRVGLMGLLAEAALKAGGKVTGVITEALVHKEVAHDHLTELRVVKSMHERKALMADRADAFIMLPGGFGTLDEFFEALTWAQLGIHAKPCGILDVDGFYQPLLRLVASMVEERFVHPEHARMLLVDDNPKRLLDRLVVSQPVQIEKWLGRSER